MEHQDWQEVSIKKKQPSGTSKQAVVQARQHGGEVETMKKYNAGTNKQTSQPSNAKKLDNFSFGEDEELTVHTVPKNVAMAIQQARQAKGLTQKDLATKVNEKQSVINEYESGKAVPSPQVLGKLERALNVKLRGKDIGSPLK